MAIHHPARLVVSALVATTLTYTDEKRAHADSLAPVAPATAAQQTPRTGQNSQPSSAPASVLKRATVPSSTSVVQTKPNRGDTYTPGEITVYGHHEPSMLIGSSTLSSEAMYIFNKTTLDQAINLIPGVNSANTGGSRNERTIMVRGFNRFQVPVLVDGIRIYLPADNRLDYGRFLTPDIAEIQIAKGYASVLDGPDAMGGMVNLVTRAPRKELEVEVRGGSALGHAGEYGGYNVFALVGTKHEKWYAQASFARNDVDHTDLSSNFTPTATQGKGKRLLSDSLDWRVNAKIGFTPNETDEYTVNYTRQEGEKRAPFSVVDPISIQRNWTWPAWNLDSLSLTGRTALGRHLVLKTKLYRNTFYNLLRSFDDSTETTQTKPKAFNSYYNDAAWGGSARLEAELSARDTFGIAFYGRLDQHHELQQTFPGGGWQPEASSVEQSYSIAGENTFHILPTLSLQTGVSYDWRVLDHAEGASGTTLIQYPVKNRGAPNGQARLSWQPDAKSELHISVSDRVRFPTLFERFSTRFGGAVSNPGLRPERTQNYEIGGAHTFGHVEVEGALFYSHLTDLITSFPMIYNGVAVTQSRNVNSANYMGAEISVALPVTKKLLVGGNYTYIHQDINDTASAITRPTDVPTHKAFVYAEWKPIRHLRFVPSVDIASNRWTTNTAGTAYFRTGHNVNIAARVDYQITPQLQIGANASNLLDQNYQMVSGFPEPGRNFYLNLRVTY